MKFDTPGPRALGAVPIQGIGLGVGGGNGRRLLLGGLRGPKWPRRPWANPQLVRMRSSVMVNGTGPPQNCTATPTTHHLPGHIAQCVVVDVGHIAKRVGLLGVVEEH